MVESGNGVINEQGILYGETPVMEFEESKKEKKEDKNEK